jgi:hypothetical protein
MKTKLIAALLLVASVAYSQYFEKMYNITAASDDRAGKGVNSSLATGDNLYYQAGTTTYTQLPPAPAIKSPMITGTDKNGNMLFCTRYNLPAYLGNTVLPNGRAVARDPISGNVVIVGDFTTSPTVFNGVFIYSVNYLTGAVIAGSLRYFINPSGNKMTAAAIKIVTVGGVSNMVACGSAESSTLGSYNTWALRYTMAWVGWFKIYDETLQGVAWNTKASDLVESSFAGTREIGIVGETILSGDYRGYLLRLDVLGNLLSYRTYDSGVATGEDRFTSITQCNDLALANVPIGYVIAGYSNVLSNALSSRRVWALRTNNVGNTIYWNNIYSYVNTNDSYANGIVEVNNGGVFKYYISGSAIVGVLGGADPILYELKNDGTTAIGGGLTTIGIAGIKNEYGINIDLSNSTNTYPGLTIYGQREMAIGNNDFYMIKCGFAGTLGAPSVSCTSQTVQPSIKSQPSNIVDFTVAIASVNTLTNTNPAPVSGTQTPLCNFTTAPRPANSSLATSINEEVSFNNLAFIVSPNPSNGFITIKTEALVENISLTINDLIGKILYKKEFNNLVNEQIDLSTLKNGIYFINISDSKGLIETKKIIKQ